MQSRQVYVLAALMCSIAVGLLYYKLDVLHLPLRIDSQVRTWEVEVSVNFQAEKGPIKVELYIPQSEGYFELQDESFLSGKYGLAIKRYVTNRRAVWSTRKAQGQQFLWYRASFRQLPQYRPLRPKNPPTVQGNSLTGTGLIAAQNILQEVRSQSADLDSLVGVLLSRLASDVDDDVHLLLAGDASLQQRGRMAVDILSLADVPARLVHGFELQSMSRQARSVVWLEVYEKGQWLGFDLHSGSRELADNLLPWWREERPLYRISGGRHANVSVATGVSTQSALYTGRGSSQSGLLDFSLLILPLETQAVYHVLLLVPLGVFVLVLMRNLVGIKTFGTFMPVLIALAFRETQLLVGMVLFVLIIGLGLSIRFYLDRLNLLLVPRLASVLIVVILLMSVISVLSYKLGLPRGLSIALFPMVIITMTIERMSIVWEERGAMEALQQGGGSLLVAAVAYLVMNVQDVGRFLLVYPESLLFILSATLLLGRYSGYRLLELVRFRAFMKAER